MSCPSLNGRPVRKRAGVIEVRRVGDHAEIIVRVNGHPELHAPYPSVAAAWESIIRFLELSQRGISFQRLLEKHLAEGGTNGTR